MVAAATALCLDPTNVHRQSSKNSAAFISLAGAVVDHNMALNFGVSAAGKLLSSSPPKPTDASNNTKMDTLLVSNLHAIPQISPGTAALRKINEVLARSSSSASPSTPNSQQHAADENSPSSTTSTNNEASVHLAEQFKEQLMKAIDNNNFEEVGKLIDEIESAHLNKNALEISRIGAVVNTLRRNIASTHADLARKCRSLIKSWRSNVEVLNSSRPSSSCGSSAGTPSLVSPAIRLKITPRGKTITPTSQLAYEGFNANSSYAPSLINKTSPQLVSTKRKASVVSPNSNSNQIANKRAKLSPNVAPTPTQPMPISVIEARRNVQSTESLLAAMGMEKFLNSTTADKKPDEIAPSNGVAKVEPIIVPPIQSPEKRGRKKREPKTDGQQPQVPRLKIRFGGKSAEEHSVDEASKKNDLSEEAPSTSNAVTSTTGNNRQPSSSKKSNKKMKAQPKSEFSWYAKLPTIEELELRSKKPQELISEKSETPLEPIVSKFRERQIILMPYLDSNEPDFLLYDYPDKEKFMAQKRRF